MILETKKNKLILFDWGNIVESHDVGFGNIQAWNELFTSCGYTGDKVIFNSLGKYQLSKIMTNEEFESTYNDIKEEFKLNTSYEEFVENYKRIFDNINYFKEVADYEHSLKDKCYIGILSNLTIFDKERLDKQVGLSNYDYVFLSFELGLRKPNIEIYERVQQELPFNKEDILFIDDRSNNIESASSFGWNTFQCTGLELDKIKEVCEEFIK
jgi:putative hydrolase of the HAD superfamily